MITNFLKNIFGNNQPEPTNDLVARYDKALAGLQQQLAIILKDRDYLQAQNTLLMSQLASYSSMIQVAQLQQQQLPVEKKAPAGF